MTYFYRMYKNADHKELTQNISKHLSAHFTSATLKHSLVITVQTARQESGPFSVITTCIEQINCILQATEKGRGWEMHESIHQKHRNIRILLTFQKERNI